MTARDPGDGPGLADLHSHLVPGVDDGARTVDDAVEGIGRLVEAGVRTIMTTPHLDVSLEGSRALDRRFVAVEDAWSAVVEVARVRYPGVSLRRGFEVLLDLPDPTMADARLRLGDTRFVLVEWPHMALPRGTVRVLAGLRDKGVTPVVAHPERYAGLGRALDVAGEWRAVGAFLQVNHGSLHGRYGREARARALELLRRGWVDLLASDFHGRSHLLPYVAESRAWFTERGAEGIFEALAGSNPRRVLADEDPRPVTPLDLPRGMVERIRTFLNMDGPSR
jgi:protein-tyrosine phosphatase